MTDKIEKTAVSSGVEDTKNLGRPADPEIKKQRPQVADKEKLAGAISSIDDLSARLARLDSQKGPFESEEGALGGRMFDALLDDVDDVPVVAVQETRDDSIVETEVVSDGNPEEDETLITSLIVDEKPLGEDETLSDLDSFFNEARVDKTDEKVDPQATPESALASETDPVSEEENSQGDDFPSALNDFLEDVEGEEFLGIMDEDIHDPIDDLMDQDGDDDIFEDDTQATADRDHATSDDSSHASPFAALFSNVEVDFEDPGAVDDLRSEDRIHIEEYDPDDDLFYTPDEESEIFGAKDTPEAVKLITQEEDDELLDINSSLYETADDDGEHDDEDAISALNDDVEDPIYEDQSGSSDLPVLMMGQDESLYAPGTSYEDEKDNTEEVESDISDVDDNLQANEILAEEEDQMGIKMNISDKSEDTPEDEKNFSSTDLDDLLGDDTSEGDGIDDDAYYGDLADEQLSDDALAKFEDDDGASSDEVDAATLLFSDDDEPAGADLNEANASESGVGQGEAEIPAPGEAAKKKRSGTMAMAIASVSLLAVLGGGYAYTNGMLPPIPGIPTYGLTAPAVVATPAPDRDMSPIIPVEVEKDDLGVEVEVADLAPPETVEVKDLTPIEDLNTSDDIDPEIAALLDELPRNVDNDLKDSSDQSENDADIVVVDDMADDGSLSTAELATPVADPDDMFMAPDPSMSDGDMEVSSLVDESDDLGEVQLPLVGAETEDETLDVAEAGSENDASGDGDLAENIDVAEVSEADLEAGDVVTAEMQDTEASEDMTAIDGDLIGLAEVLQNEEMQEIATGAASAGEAAEVTGGNEVIDPLAALAAEIDAVGKPVVEDEVPAVVLDNSVFVEEERVIAIEETVATLGESLVGMTDEMKKLNKLIIQSLEQDAAVARRVEVNEQSLRTTSAILSELSSMKGSLDQTQVVLLDIAARVGTLEGANPADRQEVSEEIRQMKGEIQKLSANMSIIARMTVNGVTALTAEGASAGNHGVRTTTAKQPNAGNDLVFSNGETAPAAPKAPNIPKDVRKNDYVEGYGYVLDVVPASGNQKLVVMENGSALIPE